MDLDNKEPDVFEITRYTARAAGLSWCGTFFFVTGLLASSYLFFDLNSDRGLKIDASKYFELLRKLNIVRNRPLTDVEVFRWSVFIVLFFILAIILWVASKNAQRGTIMFFDDRISCKCERTFVDLMPGQISSVRREANVVKITYLASTLTIKSDKAALIADRVQNYVNEHKFSVNKTDIENDSITVSPEKIREYKQLVEEGIITQDQFDEIIKKLTKE